jgi:hypothetical protein
MMARRKARKKRGTKIFCLSKTWQLTPSTQLALRRRITLNNSTYARFSTSMLKSGKI